MLEPRGGAWPSAPESVLLLSGHLDSGPRVDSQLWPLGSPAPSSRAQPPLSAHRVLWDCSEHPVPPTFGSEDMEAQKGVQGYRASGL